VERDLVWSLGVGVSDLGFGVWGLGFTVSSVTPREEERWPPVFDTDSITCRAPRASVGGFGPPSPRRTVPSPHAANTGGGVGCSGCGLMDCAGRRDGRLAEVRASYAGMEVPRAGKHAPPCAASPLRSPRLLRRDYDPLVTKKVRPDLSSRPPYISAYRHTGVALYSASAGAAGAGSTSHRSS
jgi:hypothetical protein